MNPKWLTVCFVFILLFASCSNKYQKFVPNYTFTNPAGTPDYSNLDYWAAHPYKKDPSDSIPLLLREGYKPDSLVDIFFVYPTTYTDKKKSMGWNALIDNAELNAKTDYSSILYQASVFNEAGRVFSPRYRQANFYCYFPKTKEDTTKALAAFELAYEDVKTAFLYYMQHYNNGRPVIIASHSQGTTHTKRLLKELFDGKELQNKLVAAYLAGMQVEPDYFQFIKPCTTPTQTGCFCSWRTFRDGYKPEYVKNEKDTAIVTNPLTWDATKPEAERADNPGGLLLNFKKIIKGITNAKVNSGVLWTEKPHFFGNLLFTTKNYHVADINLFYVSIRENAKQRVAAFTKK